MDGLVGLIALVVSAVAILSMLIFSVNENVATAAFFPTAVLRVPPVCGCVWVLE